MEIERVNIAGVLVPSAALSPRRGPGAVDVGLRRRVQVVKLKQMKWYFLAVFFGLRFALY